MGHEMGHEAPRSPADPGQSRSREIYETEGHWFESSRAHSRKPAWKRSKKRNPRGRKCFVEAPTWQHGNERPRVIQTTNSRRGSGGGSADRNTVDGLLDPLHKFMEAVAARPAGSNSERFVPPVPLHVHTHVGPSFGPVYRRPERLLRDSPDLDLQGRVVGDRMDQVLAQHSVWISGLGQC
jgi:hypothetical protein